VSIIPEKLLRKTWKAEIRIIIPAITAKMRSKTVRPVNLVRMMAAIAPEFEYRSLR
jgi:hypothetical protein